MFKYDGVGPGNEPMLVDQIRALEAHVQADAREIDTLHNALGSARRIGTAIGIIMATLRVTSEAAFDVLRVASQNGNRKLHDIADDVVHTGVVPLVPGLDDIPR